MGLTCCLACAASGVVSAEEMTASVRVRFGAAAGVVGVLGLVAMVVERVRDGELNGTSISLCSLCCERKGRSKSSSN